MKGWDRQRSRGRIGGFMGTVPQGNISVRTFDEGMLQRRISDIARSRAPGSVETTERIFDVSPGKAIVVDGVHVYVQLIDYAQQMLDIGNETEPGHRRLLQALHVHYATCDSVAEEFGAQRVDYHGPRMHAVIATPIGNERDRVIRALEFADAVKLAIEEVGNKVAGGTLRTRVRIGIDSGKAVAIDSGNSDEREPLFLGNPANYAAKLADGEVPGIFPSANIRRVLALDVPQGGFLVEQTRSISAVDVQRVHPGRRIVADAQLVTRAVTKVEERFSNGTNLPTFVFHRHEPPLRTIDFADVGPSNSIRMDLLSVFADIDKFTAYVDRCITSGNVAEMVANLHVIRGELAATLKEDFDGRKIRFIGDCIHGIVANGTRAKTDHLESVRSAVAAAAGMRSSFELCQEMLPGIAGLGLAIGIDLGTTSVTRIGLRGDRSVRCCVSKAVSSSESLQSASEGDETKIGSRALTAAPASIQRIFDEDGVAAGLDYSSYIQHVGAPAIVKSGTVSRPALPYLR